MRKRKQKMDKTVETDMNKSKINKNEVGENELDENELEEKETEDEGFAEKEEERGGSGIFWNMMLFISLAVFVFSAYQLYSIFAEYKEGTDQYADISNMVVDKPVEPPVIVEEKEIINEQGEVEKPYTDLPEYAAPEVDFEELMKVNDDVIGWIEVEAIPSISYPIVQADDNDYYLKRTIYKKWNSAGSIFADYSNDGAFSDCNTIIYGHNMKNGSMFGLLSNLYEDEKYRESPYIWICTPNGKYRYEIFSMQYTHANSSTYTFHQTQGDDFLQYLIKMASVSEVDFKIPYLSGDDRIITLSTCTSDKNTRFVVQARWIATY